MCRRLVLLRLENRIRMIPRSVLICFTQNSEGEQQAVLKGLKILTMFFLLLFCLKCLFLCN